MAELLDLATLWVIGVWPLLLGFAIAAIFRSLLVKPRNSLLVVVAVYGLEGLCELPSQAARLILLVDHSPNWMNSSQAITYMYFGGNLVAALLAVLFSRRIAAWAGRFGLEPN
jgi:hypothetical protein